MSATYKTPGVYIEEISAFPPSVAPVSTAVPAFVGFTQKAADAAGNSLTNKPLRISTFLDYQTYFGGPPTGSYTVTVEDTGSGDGTQKIDSIQATFQPGIPDPDVANSTRPACVMYYALQLYFQNGGGPCYIVSLGTYADAAGVTAASQYGDSTTSGIGFNTLDAEDEPTLLVAPDAPGLLKQGYPTLCQNMLLDCGRLMDRFAILDAPCSSTDVGNFRTGVGMGSLDYGAAYTPDLQTTIAEITTSSLDPTKVSITQKGATPTVSGYLWSQPDCIQVGNTSSNPYATVNITADSPPLQVYEQIGCIRVTNAATSTSVVITSAATEAIAFTATSSTLTISGVVAGTTTGTAIATAWTSWTSDHTNDANGFSIIGSLDGATAVQAVTGTALAANPIFFTINPATKALGIGNVGLGKTLSARNLGSISTVLGLQIADAWKTWSAALTAAQLQGFSLAQYGQGKAAITAGSYDISNPVTGTPSTGTLNQLQNTQTGLYNQVLSALEARTVTLPPSAAIAGVYCSVDGSRGVWKSPANVSLLSVTAPAVKITNDMQDGLNVDPASGKSINAIRSFTGQGILVWGARTLAGNDNNWRYISVRRLFIFMEESIQQATSWAVFEPNMVTTWLKVKASIESFLYGLWQQGALVGSTPQEAFYVNIGLGTTMTADDILNGVMNVVVGAAPSRPAEFIVMTFTQKLQGS